MIETSLSSKKHKNLPLRFIRYKRRCFENSHFTSQQLVQLNECVAFEHTSQAKLSTLRTIQFGGEAVCRLVQFFKKCKTVEHWLFTGQMSNA